MVAKRHEAWALLRYLSRMGPDPWLCVGDFNEILLASEKSSSTPRPPSQMLAFRKALEDSQLMDLGFRGPKYTWCNGRSGGEYTKERLDRALAIHGWSDFFNVVEVQVLARNISDHSPLLVSFAKIEDIQWRKCRKFCFEASWTWHKEQEEIVQNAWKATHHGYNPWTSFHKKLDVCRKSLKQWVRKIRSPVDMQIQQKMQELHAVQTDEVGALQR